MLKSTNERKARTGGVGGLTPNPYDPQDYAQYGEVAETIHLLRLLDPHGPHNLAAKRPNNRSMNGRTFGPGSEAKIATAGNKLNGQGYNIYVSVNRPKPNAPNKKLEKEDIAAYRAVTADLDLKEGETREAGFARMEAVIGEAPPSTITVMTRNGLQVWWMLDAPIPAGAEMRRRIEGLGRSIAIRLGGDPTQNVDRVLRAPGTISYPNASKKKRGYTEGPTSIHSETGIRYSLEELEAAFPAIAGDPDGVSDELLSKERQQAKAALDMDAVHAVSKWEDLPAELRERFDEARQRSESLDTLWRDGHPEGDGSKAVVALSGHLVHHGGFTVTEFGVLVQVWPHAEGRKGLHLDDGTGNGDERSIYRAWGASVAQQTVGDPRDAFEAVGGQDGNGKASEGQNGGPPTAAASTLPPYDFWAAASSPDLPLGLLPKAIESFAMSQAAITGADAGGFAMAALAVCAGVISDAIKLQVLQHSNFWMETGRIWVGLVGDPSKKKSPIIRAATRPAFEIDLELARRYKLLKQFYDTAPKDNKPELPVYRRLLLTDTTAEAAQETLKGSPDGVLLAYDELSGFFDAQERYSHGGGDRAFWLQAYNGGYYLVSRVGRGNFDIPNLSVSMLGGIQPGVIRRVASNAVDDGLIQRIIPINLRRGATAKDVPPTPEAAGYDKLIKRLHDRRPARDPFDRVEHLQLDEAARDIRAGLEKEHQQLSEMQEHHGNRKLSAAIIKQDGLFARLVIIWHVIETIDEPELPTTITVDTAQRVADFLTKFLQPHLFAFYDEVLGVSVDQDRLRAIAGYILAHKSDVVVSRDIQAAVNSVHRIGTRDLTLLLEQLEALGWVKHLWPGARANASPRWKVMPRVHQDFTRQAKIEKEARRQVVEKLAEMRRNSQS